MSDNYLTILLNKIENRKAVVGVVGLGYVGLPLALGFVESGFSVLGFDVDPEKVAKIKRGENYLGPSIDHQQFVFAANSDLLHATDDFARISEVDAIIMCLPTPLNSYRIPDLSYVTGTLETILPFLRKGQVISLESTTYPGTTDEEIVPRIQSAGFKTGDNFFVVYSPERIDPGNQKQTVRSIPKVVSGLTGGCLKIGLALYSTIIDRVVPVSTTRAAELTKLLENIYRSVNIALVNEIKIVADRMGINIFEVIEAASTKPFGFHPFYPGPGWGGHCIPIDPFYLSWKAREYDVQTRFIELAGEVNTYMPEWITGKVTDGLNDRGKAVKGSRILVLGIAYKKNISDTRESPAVKLMELLRQKGAVVSYSDPYVPVFPKMREHTFELESVDITAELLQLMDCIVIVTDHDKFDYEHIHQHAALIVDSRGRYRDKSEKVIPC